MSAYYSVHRSGGKSSRLVLIFVILVVLFAGAVLGGHYLYNKDLSAVSNNAQEVTVTIPLGSSSNSIATQLEKAHLIRSAQSFRLYVRNRSLQAGTYKLRPNQSVPQIVSILAQGKVATDLVTILPGQRIDQIRTSLIKSGFSAAAVDTALDASQYRASYPALADNPASASLEGFLYPDSYQKSADTDPKVIVGEALDEMQNHLTTDIRTGFASQGLSVFQGVTLASMVEREVSKPDDRAQAAQVFLKRYHIDMPLGSDVTAFYGAVIAGHAPAVDYDSPYNTLIHKGLPVGPISNVSDSSLKAVAHPASTDWLYFVAGDDGTTYFSKTLEEHQALVNKYCHKLCAADSAQ